MVEELAATDAPGSTRDTRSRWRSSGYDGPWPPPIDAICATPTDAALSAARRHFSIGVSHYQEGNYAAAVDEFETAYRLACHAHKLLYNLGKAHELAGKFSKAVAAYRLYLDRETTLDASERAEIEARIQNLKAKPNVP